jgi:thioredoxin-dependent peroxiredoxin
MRNDVPTSILLVILLCLGANNWISSQQARVYAASADIADVALPQAGQAAPGFTLPSQSGTATTLSSFKGQWVVLYFYPEDMTAGCSLEAHNFQRDAEKFQKMHAVILGVSVDSIDSHKQFCAKEGLNIKLLSDTERRVVAQYGSLNSASKMADRNTFLINPRGKIVKVWTRVDPARHSAEVLATLASDIDG